MSGTGPDWADYANDMGISNEGVRKLIGQIDGMTKAAGGRLDQADVATIARFAQLLDVDHQSLRIMLDRFP